MSPADISTAPVPLRRVILSIYCGLVFLFLVLPNFVVIPLSFSPALYLEFPPRALSLRWYQDYFARQEWVAATVTSFEVGILVTLCSVSLGSLAAYGLARGRFPGRNFLNSLIISPMVVPTLVIAVAIYKLYSDLKLIGTLTGFVLAHTVLATPFVVIIISATLRGIDPQVEYAAMSLGASRLTTLRRVVFPLVLPGLLSAGLFAFLISFDELLIALFISSPTLVTLPKKIWDGIRTEINPTIAAVSTLLVLLSLLVLLGTVVVRRVFEKRSQ
jgi:putative spermidine/putrescine transport system permease protein